MYPYKESSLRRSGLVAINFLIPIFTILILEFILAGLYHQKLTVNEGNKNKGIYVRFAFKALCAFFIGYGINLTATYAIKFVTGRLRPNFFDVCNPNYERPCKHQFYYNNAICTRNNLLAIRNSRLSFPSKYASTSMYSMVFIALYLHLRARLCRLQSFKTFFQTCFILLSLYICSTRIADYRNHWGDVLAGLILGAIFGIIFANSAVNSIYSFLDRKIITRLDSALPDSNYQGSPANPPYQNNPNFPTNNPQPMTISSPSRF
ncbi:phospholipid phosphatase 1-like isoform X2 [Gordionus sp. m RMFG-2023]